jgi:hypothetical protein
LIVTALLSFFVASEQANQTSSILMTKV